MISVIKNGLGCVLIVLVLIFQAGTACGADSMTEIQVPTGLSQGVRYLLDLAAPENREPFQPGKIKKLLEYITEPKDPEALYYADPKLGSPSAYFDFDVRQHFDHILKYTFNPDIPGHLTAPSSTRMSNWKQVQDSDGRLPALWNNSDKLETPIIVRGIEAVENTPDVFSGAYYAYDLYRTLILFNTNNRKVLISISKQKSISDVGKKGYVLGSDDNWDYFYSGKPGLSIPGLGWVKSHMYDSYGINIYMEIDSGAPLLRCAVFRWITAGWSKINVVKRHHIHNGIKRFEKSFKEVMEHPSLPDIDTLSDVYSKIKALTEHELGLRIEAYLNILEKSYGSDYRPPRRWSPQVFKDKKAWFQMSPAAMQSVLMIEYMKHALGKRDAAGIVALRDMSE